MTRPRTVLARELLEDRLVAVLRARDAADYAPVVEVLVACGIRSIEVTLTTPRALDELPRVLGRVVLKRSFIDSCALSVTARRFHGCVFASAPLGRSSSRGDYRGVPLPCESRRAWRFRL